MVLLVSVAVALFLVASEVLSTLARPTSDLVSAAEAQVDPVERSTLAAVPGATACSAPVPLPSSTLFSARVFDPVPPLATGRMPVTSRVRLTD